MWIRSQSKKTLGNYKVFYISDNKIYAESSTDTDIIGEYKTKERALEVLNDIQNWIIELNREIRTDNVYEMPQK